VFQRPKYLQNSFSVLFSRKPSIRRNVFEFETRLDNLYIKPPQIISIPDEVNPEMPRIIFTSKSMHSQIVISQINFVLNVNYSGDLQFNISESKKYLLEQVSILFELLNIIGEKQPSFCGFNTLVQIPTNGEDVGKMISRIYNTLLTQSASSSHFEAPDIYDPDIYEFQFKISKVIKQEFFSNIAVQNYRNWNNIEIGEGILKLSKDKITESGIQIMADFNDRYAFNEIETYSCKEDKAKEIVEASFIEIDHIIEIITRSL